MKKLVLFALMIYPSTQKLSAQPLRIKLRFLRNYYVINERGFKNDLNFRVITERKELDKYFGVINKPDTPNFSNQWVIFMALPGSKKESKLSFDSVAVKAGYYMEVYYHVKRDIFPVSYTTHPIAIATIPIFKTLEEIHFYDRDGMRLTETVKIKR